MSTHSSHQASSQITQPDNLNGRRQTPPGDFYIASESPVANMGPPTFSYDPSLDAWQNPSVLSPRPDDLLLPSNKVYAQLHERSSLPITSGNSMHQSDDFRLPSIRGENNSMTRWNNDIGPWTPFRHTGGTGQSLMIQPHARFTMQRPSPYSYRDSTRSEVSVSTTGQPLHDSAYDSRSFVSNSESSLDHRDASRSCPSDTVDLNGLPYGVGSNVSQDDHHSSLDGASDSSYRPRISASLTCQYEQCTHVSRNNSEHKKHVSRHSKPHKCKNCSKSFSTLNDTERHMKSVHKIAPKNGTDRSFRCAALNCTRKDKIWPRLDNFRQHCNRIHKGDNIDELVRKSAITYSVQPWNAGPGSSGTMGSAEQYSLSSNHERSNYTTLAHVSLSPGVSSPIGMDPQYDVRVDHIWQGNASNDPAFVSVTQATDRVVEHFATTNTNTHSSILDKAAGHTHIRNTCSSPDASLLQVPSNKRPRMTDNPQGRESQLNEKRQKTLPSALSEVAVVHQTVQERPTDTRSSCSNLEAIYTSAKDSGASEEQLSLITRALTIRGEGSTNDHPMPQINCEGIALETKKKPIECDQCHKKMARRCDLRKHNKRHTRPYGCTFATCSKAFGSKNDWKRHENTRHYQIETWRCHESNSRSQINQCAKIFYRREQFQAHLKDTHLIKDDEVIRDQCKKYRIGRNGQSGFWCGFCKKIVTLKHKGLEAWDERFDHIDKEHFRLGQRIDDHWYPLDKDIPIGSLPSAAEPDSDAPNSPPGNDDSDEDGHEDENPHEVSAPNQNGVPEGPPPEYQMTAKDAYVTKSWYCCMCQDGPNNVSVVKKCNNCSHGRCRACVINKGAGAPAGFPDLTL